MVSPPAAAVPAGVGARTRAAALPPEARRASLLEATRALLVQHGAAVTTRQIAEAAGVAEGTIFRVFPDKDSLLQAVLDLVLDPAPAEEALGAIDRSLPFEEQLVEAVTVIQRRLHDIWQVMAAMGTPAGPPKKSGPVPFAALTALFAANADAISCRPAYAAQTLRAITLAMTHPAIAPEKPLKPRAIVSLFLDGVRARTSEG